MVCSGVAKAIPKAIQWLWRQVPATLTLTNFLARARGTVTKLGDIRAYVFC